MGSRQRWVRLLAPIVAVLLISEFAVRAAESRLPEQFEFQSAEVDIKVAQMNRLASQGGVDVVVIGSSLVTAGIQPDILSDALGATVYNAGLAASTPILLEPWLTDVVLPRLNPTTVLIGVTGYDFFDDPTAREFLAAFEESPGGRRATNSEGVFDRAGRWFRDRSALWRHKQSLRDPEVWSNALFERGQPGDPWIERYTAGLDATGAVRQSVDIRLDSSRPTGGPNVENWSLGTDSPQALRNMTEAVIAQGATPILVGMPVSQQFVDRYPQGSQSYEQFRDALHNLGADLGVAVLDYDTRDADYFADVVHLNGWGATAFTQALADDIDAGPDHGELPTVPGSQEPKTPDHDDPSTTPAATIPTPPPLTLPELDLPAPDPPTSPTLPPVPTVPGPSVPDPPLDLPTDP